MVGGVPWAWMFRWVHNYDLKKRSSCLWPLVGMIIMTWKKRLSHLAGSQIHLEKKVESSGRQWECLGGFHELGCFSGFIITTWKKMYSCLAFSRNGNYNLKKKVQWFGGCIITSKKKGSAIWPSVGIVVGVPWAWMFWRRGVNWWHSITPIRCLPGNESLYFNIT